MSSCVAGANKEQPAGMRHNKMSLCKDISTVRRASRLTDTNTKERVAIWNAVAACVREQLMVQKGVWIPTFGSFDVVPKDISSRNGTVTLFWPVFHLAKNLIGKHRLKFKKESLTAHKELELLKYSEVATIANVTQQRGRACVQSTVSLLSSCLQNGENVAFVLKGIGVLVIDRLTFQMNFYYDLVEKLSGKEILRRAVSKAPWLLDMLISQVTPLASLTLSPWLIIFPRFQMEFVPKASLSASRKSSRNVRGEVKPKKGGALPPLVRTKTVRFAERPKFIKRLSTASIEGGHFAKIRSLLMERSVSSLKPAMRGVPEAHKKSVTCQLQGQAGTESQEDLGRAPGTEHVIIHNEEKAVEVVHCECGMLEMQKRNKAAFKQGTRPSSRAEVRLSKEPESRPARNLPKACDSVTLLRRRAKKAKPVREEPQEMAASASPRKSSTNRSGLLPPIHQDTGSPRC
ncbi:coiled-coil domain-containing protein 81-like [Cyrtonyx montezumae]|uniref:coiled-coil domain-containing protein 81-like n=1 Tax=Cyrtonyx montezumae TaxID=9017 RepID=UPI0032D9FBBF